MPRNRTALEQAAGKLILRIQQEWMQELGEPAAADSEQVMNRAHDLLQAASARRPASGCSSSRSKNFWAGNGCTAILGYSHSSMIWLRSCSPDPPSGPQRPAATPYLT
jgi:hypothetical protein